MRKWRRKWKGEGERSESEERQPGEKVRGVSAGGQLAPAVAAGGVGTESPLGLLAVRASLQWAVGSGQWTGGLDSGPGQSRPSISRPRWIMEHCVGEIALRWPLPRPAGVRISRDLTQQVASPSSTLYIPFFVNPPYDHQVPSPLELRDTARERASASNHGDHACVYMYSDPGAGQGRTGVMDTCRHRDAHKHTHHARHLVKPMDRDTNGQSGQSVASVTATIHCPSGVHCHPDSPASRLCRPTRTSSCPGLGAGLGGPP